MLTLGGKNQSSSNNKDSFICINVLSTHALNGKLYILPTSIGEVGYPTNNTQGKLQKWPCSVVKASSSVKTSIVCKGLQLSSSWGDVVIAVLVLQLVTRVKIIGSVPLSVWASTSRIYIAPQPIRPSVVRCPVRCYASDVNKYHQSILINRWTKTQYVSRPLSTLAYGPWVRSALFLVR